MPVLFVSLFFCLLLLFFVFIDKHLVTPILENLSQLCVSSYCSVTDILSMMQPRNSEHHNLYIHFIDIILFSLTVCHYNGVVVTYGFLPLLQRCSSWAERTVKPGECILQPRTQQDSQALAHLTHNCVKKSRKRKEEKTGKEIKRRSKEGCKSFSEILYW